LVTGFSVLPSILRSFPGSEPVESARVQLASFSQDEVPSLDGGVGWINSGPIELAKLKGKIVLLDFWTYCCINCHHVLPVLARLEQKYKNEVVVIGVHSGKFSSERNTENIRRKVAEYRIKHPVVNDENMTIWERFKIVSWPTLVVIGPNGQEIGRNPGEISFEHLDRFMGQAVANFKGQLNLKPLVFDDEAARPSAGPLLFPGKVLADVKGKRLFISDTGHNRIVQTDLDGKDPIVIGNGAEGLVDGGYDKARFNRQQGMHLEGETLYVADTENHAIRAVDLKAKHVTTIAGTGFQAPRDPRQLYHGTARTSALSSPWDVIQIPGSRVLYIAMAGPHQIWKLDLEAGKIGVWAGTGEENIRDGDLHHARFAQPSGLATDGENLYVADSEVSGVRVITGIHTEHPHVGRIAGMGLFAFGDIDGAGAQVRLQHCLGLAFGHGKLYIADTYNNKVKVCDPKTLEITTFAGTGEPGDADNPPRFYQPGGLSVGGDMLYVADTNNGKIRVIDLKTKAVHTLDFSGLTASRSEERVSSTLNP